jgi:hypothetical protein
MLEPNRWAWRPQEGPQQALVSGFKVSAHL